MTIADFSMTSPAPLQLSQMHCRKSIPSAANSAFPLCCEQLSNTCKLWSFLISWTGKVLFENFPFWSVCHMYLSGSLQIFSICSEPTLSPDKYLRAHSGHILLPRSQWGQELLQSVHTKVSCKLSVARFILPYSHCICLCPCKAGKSYQSRYLI